MVQMGSLLLIYMICVFQGRQIPGLHDLHGLLISLPGESRNILMIYTAHVSCVGYILCYTDRSCTIYHNERYRIYMMYVMYMICTICTICMICMICMICIICII